MRDHIVVSRATIDRLPLYFRTLGQIKKESIAIISSEELGRRIGVTSEQIRKDLAYFGEFGKKGVGYHVCELANHIGEILGLDRVWNMALIGYGHLGGAFVNYKHFSNLGFQIKAVFDLDPAKIGKPAGNLIVQSFSELEKTVADNNIQIAIITVPAIAAQDVADRLVAAGIKGIWNFAPVILSVPENIRLCSEDLSVGLTSLSYHLSRN